MVGSGGSAGQLPVPGRPTTLEYGRQGPAVLAAGAGRVGFFFFFLLLLLFVCVCVCVCLLLFFVISFILSSFSNASSAGRQLDILKYCGLGRYNPAVVSVTTSLSTD